MGGKERNFITGLKNLCEDHAVLLSSHITQYVLFFFFYVQCFNTVCHIAEPKTCGKARVSVRESDCQLIHSSLLLGIRTGRHRFSPSFSHPELHKVLRHFPVGSRVRQQPLHWTVLKALKFQRQCGECFELGSARH